MISLIWLVTLIPAPPAGTRALRRRAPRREPKRTRSPGGKARA